ncbi:MULTISPECIES: hypothetical protein [unclassified Moorena]|uniref:hypothetical protein n=1 Tax=unclassified Moorena TaxID=2683338 RepID=UPI0013CD5670|nr:MULTISPECIES: hypothetical protein [unclassified Moorena]NEO18408.1 hypothetical protein [Moorena sp. SIO4A5]NEQ57446.1 hypothetical protein [Moorena sp. SIO4A1]
MKYPIRVLLSLLTLCTIGLGTNNVSAESNQCREIRAVRRLAIRENLDRDNLATLESKYCGNSNLPSSSIESRLNSSEDCFNLTVMAELASMTEEGRNFVGTIKSLRQVPCKLPRQGQSSFLNWPNGETAKLGSSWNYPNGQTAKLGSSWNYPNGQTAKLGSSWYTPKGRFTSVDDLLSQGCSIVSTTECDRILTYINRFDQNPSDGKNSEQNRRSNLLRNLGIVKLSWLSYQETNQSQ